MISKSGNIFYKDDYGQVYEVTWETIGSSIDITTVTKQPYVWAEQDQGHIKNRAVFRKGVVTTHRQVLKEIDGGYIIVAEGASQNIETFQHTFPCGDVPVDKFKYHLDCNIADDEEFQVAIGPRWADPSVSADVEAVWGNVNSDGSVTADSGDVSLEYIDIWPAA